MSDLYLILHKVRGEPHYDVAIRHNNLWIIPTSGHAAYPAAWVKLHNFLAASPTNILLRLADPYYLQDLPDHYAVNNVKPRPSAAARPNAPQAATTDELLESL